MSKDDPRQWIVLAFVVLFILFLMTACSANTSSTNGTILPPARYDHEMPGLTVMQFPMIGVKRVCGKQRIACAPVGDGKPPCWIVIPNTVPIGGAVYRHERAHCNGWPRHHPK